MSISDPTVYPPATSECAGGLPALLTVHEARRQLGCGRSVLYGLIASGQLDARKLGRRTLVTGPSIERLVAGLPAARIAPSRPSCLARRKRT